MNLIGHLQGLSNRILAYHLFTIPWNIHGDSVTGNWKNPSFLDPYLTLGVKIKIQKAFCTSTRHTPSYLRASFVYYLKCRWSSSDKPFMIEKVIVQSSYDFRGKMKMPNPYCKSARHAHSYPGVSIVYSWKCRCTSTDKLYRKRETSFFDPGLTSGQKWKFRNLTANLLDMINHLLEYHWSSS